MVSDGSTDSSSGSRGGMYTQRAACSIDVAEPSTRLRNLVCYRSSRIPHFATKCSLVLIQDGQTQACYRRAMLTSIGLSRDCSDCDCPCHHHRSIVHSLILIARCQPFATLAETLKIRRCFVNHSIPLLAAHTTTSLIHLSSIASFLLP